MSVLAHSSYDRFILIIAQMMRQGFASENGSFDKTAIGSMMESLLSGCGCSIEKASIPLHPIICFNLG